MQYPFLTGSPWPKSMLGLVLVLGVALVAGCASKGRLLMPTPVLYHQEPGASALFADTVPERRTPGVELLFITDRATETNPESNQPYGEGRSRSLTMRSGARWTSSSTKASAPICSGTPTSPPIRGSAPT